MRGPRKGNSIVLADLERATSQPFRFSDFFRTVCHPGVDLAPAEAPRGYAVGRYEIAIKLDCGVEQPQRLRDRLSIVLVVARHSAQKIVVRVQTTGGLTLRAFDLGLLHLRRDRPDHA